MVEFISDDGTNYDKKVTWDFSCNASVLFQGLKSDSGMKIKRRPHGNKFTTGHLFYISNVISPQGCFCRAISLKWSLFGIGFGG